MSIIGVSEGGTDIASDLVFGATAVATMLGLSRRQVYHLCEQRLIPTFKIGGTVCARRSTLQAWFARLEGADKDDGRTESSPSDPCD